MGGGSLLGGLFIPAYHGQTQDPVSGFFQQRALTVESTPPLIKTAIFNPSCSLSRELH